MCKTIEQVSAAEEGYRRITAWCDVCRADVEMLSEELVFELARVPASRVSDKLIAGDFHNVRTRDGRTFYCLDALSGVSARTEPLSLNGLGITASDIE